MTAKEIIVEALRKAGYDFVTACEAYEKRLKEFVESGKKRDWFVVHPTGERFLVERRA